MLCSSFSRPPAGGYYYSTITFMACISVKSSLKTVTMVLLDGSHSIFAVSLTWNSINFVLWSETWNRFDFAGSWHFCQERCLLHWFMWLGQNTVKHFSIMVLICKRDIPYLCMSRRKVIWPRNEEIWSSSLHIAMLYVCASHEACCVTRPQIFP